MQDNAMLQVVQLRLVSAERDGRNSSQRVGCVHIIIIDLSSLSFFFLPLFLLDIPSVKFMQIWVQDIACLGVIYVKVKFDIVHELGVWCTCLFIL